MKSNVMDKDNNKLAKEVKDDKDIIQLTDKPMEPQALINQNKSSTERMNIETPSIVKCDNNANDHTNAQLTKDIIKTNLKKLFMLKSKYDSKANDYYITQLHINQLLKEAKVGTENGIQLGHIDLLFKQASYFKTKMYFDQFVSFFISLSKIVFPNEFDANPKQALESFLDSFFDTFNSFLLNSNNAINVINEEREGGDINEDIKKELSGLMVIEKLIAYAPDNAQRYIIFKLRKPLRELYEIYFCNPIFYYNKSDNMRKSLLKRLIVFAKDFEIVPYIMNETFIAIYYNMIINMNIYIDSNANDNCNEYHEEMSSIKKASFNHLDFIDDNCLCFTFDNFCFLLIHLAIHAYNKMTPNTFNQLEVDKLIMFLERIDETKGMTHLAMRFNLKTSQNISLYPSKQWLIEYNELINQEEKYSKWNKNNIQSNDITNPSLSKNIMVDIKEVQSNEGRRHDLIDKHIIDLSRTFLFFSSFSNKININLMNLSSYIKFLCNCQLMFTIKKDTTFSINSFNRNDIVQIDHNDMKPFQSYNNFPRKEINASNTNSFIKERDVKLVFASLTGIKTTASTSHQSNTSLHQNTFHISNTYAKSDSTCSLSSSLIQQQQTQFQKSKKDYQLYQMDFEQFLNSIPVLSQYAYPKETKDTALNNILTLNIIPNLIKAESKIQLPHCDMLSNAFQLINRDDIRIILSKYSRVIRNYYNCYSDDYHEIDFNQLYEFYKDFDIFPEMISLVLLKNIYYVFSENNKRSNNEKHNFDNEGRYVEYAQAKMSFTNFLDSLAVSAMVFEFDRQFDPIKKIVFLIKRINASNGINKCRIKSGREL